jgi:4-hydroxy-4-methyl-2-oxoglutarate aldolase
VSSQVEKSMTTTQLLEHIRSKLYTAAISDALDELGFRDQAMREYLRPLERETFFCGLARTVQCEDVTEISKDCYALEIEAVDSVLPGEVVVVSTNRSVRNAPWGELLSTAATARGARGAVIDGLVRDVDKIRALGFPVFAAGIKPVDSRGRGEVVSYNQPVECGGVTVYPGDLVAADYDGVVVIPSLAVDDVIRVATEKVTREDSSRDELKRGAYLREVFARYGVL